jgi:hypothetical protein
VTGMDKFRARAPLPGTDEEHDERSHCRHAEREQPPQGELVPPQGAAAQGEQRQGEHGSQEQGQQQAQRLGGHSGLIVSFFEGSGKRRMGKVQQGVLLVLITRVPYHFPQLANR